MSDVLQDKVLRNVVFLEARAGGIQNDLVSSLAIAFRDLEASILERETFDSKRRAQRIAREIEETLSNIYSVWGDDLKLETRKAVEAVINRENKTIVSEFQVDEDDVFVLPIERLEQIVEKPIAGGLVNTWAKKFSDRQTKAIRRSLFQSVSEGLGAEEAARKLRNDGALALNRREADIIARTSMAQASNAARGDMYDAYKKYIPGFRYVATLDSRTCQICAPWDGRTAKRRRDLPSVPRHPRCRCTIVAWNRELVEDEDTRPAVLQDGRTVHHRDGATSTKFKVRNVKEVPIRTTYTEWFNTLSDKDQRQILGPARFELFKSGKLKLRQFATPTRIKSLKELEKVLDQ